MRKIFIVRRPYMSRFYELDHKRGQEAIRDFSGMIDVRYLHKETEKCIFLSRYDDAKTGYRQLKADVNYFETEEAALLELHKIYADLYAAFSDYCYALADGVTAIRRKIAETGDKNA